MAELLPSETTHFASGSGRMPGSWHVICSDHQAERLVVQSVIEMGFSACLPLIRRRFTGRKSGRSGSFTVPAFPGYVFAGWEEGAHWQSIKRARGVAGILPSVGSDTPALVPLAFMAALHSRMGADGVLEDLSVPDLLPALPAMTWARITKGPLSGSIAFVEWSTEERVGVLLEMMGGERRAKLRRDQVEPTDPL